MSENPLLLELLNQRQLLRVLVGQLLHRVNFGKCLLSGVNHLLRAYFSKVGLMLSLQLLTGLIVLLLGNPLPIKSSFQILHILLIGGVLSCFREELLSGGLRLDSVGRIPRFSSILPSQRYLFLRSAFAKRKLSIEDRLLPA
ncbi:Uncharacterised protein [Klebsiella pneumoniae]|nr:Uncharacterised protein [Klebsiella pneumoniae]